MIYSNHGGIIPMNEGLIGKLFKKKTPSVRVITINEFEEILNRVNECFKELERNESILISGNNKLLSRNRSLEYNDEARIRRDFNKGKSNICYSMCFDIKYTDQDDFDFGKLIDNFLKVASKLGFKDLDDVQEIECNAYNSDKYKDITLNMIFDEDVSLNVLYAKGTVGIFK